MSNFRMEINSDLSVAGGNMVVVMCYNGFGMWVLTQILSVTLFTAQCMSTAERGNDQL